MLKLIRKRAVENPWFFRGIMLILAIAFTISLGWWGTSSNNGNTRNIAEVDDDSISFEEYNRVYRNVSRFYRQTAKVSFDEELLRKQVLDQLVEQRLWLREAERMNLHVTDAELSEAIFNIQGFQNQGQFDSERYHRILSLQKLTPEQFERQQREELMIDKAKTLIRDSAALTPSEIAELEKSNPSNIDQERENRINQKREKTIRAYTLALKQKASISINEDLL